MTSRFSLLLLVVHLSYEFVAQQSLNKTIQSFQTIAPFNSSKSPIGSNCTKHSECGVMHTVCHQQKCKCEFGFFPRDNKIDCQLFFCNSTGNGTAICRERYQNPNAHCPDWTCQCGKSFKMDYDNQKCVPRYWLIDRLVHLEEGQHFQCSENAFWHWTNNQHDKGICRCKLGYVKSSNEVDCDLHKCYYNTDCVAWGEPNQAVECDLDNSRCKCMRHYSSTVQEEQVICKGKLNPPGPPSFSLSWWIILLIIIFGLALAGGFLFCLVRLVRFMRANIRCKSTWKRSKEATIRFWIRVRTYPKPTRVHCVSCSCKPEQEDLLKPENCREK